MSQSAKIGNDREFRIFAGMFNTSPNQFPVLLTHQPNFRDIGGIRTMDGRVVRRGLLFRSGDLSRLLKADIQRIEEIGIRMIIDFRSDRELISHPTPLITTVVENKRITIVDAARDTAERMLKENDAEGLGNILVQDYRRMVKDHQDDFRDFFRVLASTDQLPLVYHCAAGKDRTGLATYLLLIALGVSREDARKDYFLSNVYLKPALEKIIRNMMEAGNSNSEIIRPLMEVRSEYLDAALEEIDNQFGDIHDFLSSRLFVDQDLLRSRYLL